MEDQAEALFGPPPVRETIGETVYRRLREAVLAGRVPMGARINELELARAWRVSRTPIRDALRRLSAEGLLQAEPGRGMVVPVLQRADLEELYSLLEVLEGLAARRAAERAGAGFLAQVNTLIKRYGAALKQDALAEVIAADEALHEAVAEMAQHRRLAEAIRLHRLRARVFQMKAFRLRGRAGKTFREMAKLVAALRSRDPGRAETAMREHLASLGADIAAAYDELAALPPEGRERMLY
ncbi:MAG TPA: GntR family transcriptional regulator [bacterium]|nr:GntR family transcriptional regulator [bacterium]